MKGAAHHPCKRRFVDQWRLKRKQGCDLERLERRSLSLLHIQSVWYPKRRVLVSCVLSCSRTLKYCGHSADVKALIPVTFTFLDSLTNRSSGLVPAVISVMISHKINKAITHMGKEIAAACSHKIPWGCYSLFTACSAFFYRGVRHYPKKRALTVNLIRFSRAPYQQMFCSKHGCVLRVIGTQGIN